MAYKAVVVRRSDDELRHWKYIKRERKNGRWVYEYAEIEKHPADSFTDKVKYAVKDAVGYDEKSAYETAKNTYDLHKNMTDYYDEKAKEIAADADADGERTELEKSWIKLATDNRDYERPHMINAKEVVSKALKEYEKTPLYKIEQVGEYIDAGQKKVKKWLKKLFD